MANPLQRYVEAASGLTSLTRARAEQIVKQLVKQGTGLTDSAGDLVEDLLERSKRNRDAVVQLVRAETTRAIKALGLARVRDVERLQRQVSDLKARATGSRSGGSSAKRSSSDGVSRGAAPTKRSSSGAAKSSTRKKSTAKKSTAKKSTAKKSTAKRSTARKSGGTRKKSTSGSA